MELAEKIAKLSVEDIWKIAKGDIPKTEEMKYCEKHGHEENKEKRLWTGPRVICFCKRCYQSYEGTLTLEESSEWQRKLTTPCDI